MIAPFAVAATRAAEPVEIPTYLALARPEPAAVVPYGAAPSQAIDVFLPAGAGPHPVAILIHGGCWSVTTAGREQFRHLGAELAGRGTAVWSIGYRRANESGGGYPGTFEDVAAAIDLLPTHAAEYRLDLSRTVAVGHSAGGHLALWAAARDQLPADGRLSRARPFVPGTVISLGGVGDLQAFARFVPILCGPGVIERLVPSSASDDVYREISPAAMPPPRRRVVVVSGILDRLVPPYVAHDYARAVRRAGAADVELVDLPGAGHFDLVTPGTPAWEDIRARIEAAVRGTPGGATPRAGGDP